MSTEAALPRRCSPLRGKAAVFSATAVLLSAAVHAQEIPPLPPPGVDLPRVVLISTGGEIATSCETRVETAGCETAAEIIGPDRWIEDLPDLRLVARIATEDLRSPEPSDRESAGNHAYRVAGRIQQLAEDPGVDGVVVAHSTEGLADTAYFANLVVRTRKPIVFVAAVRPWSGISGDGPLNLLNAVRVAISPAAGGKGVLVAANQKIHAARDLRRTHTSRVDGFGSVDLGPLGVADPDNVRFFSEPVRRHTLRSEFSLAALPASLPAVEIVPAYADAPGRVIEMLAAAGAKGLVVDGAGSGGLSASQLEALRRARQQGVVVVATAATRGGRARLPLSVRESGVIAGDNLPPEKARVLLRLALTKTSDPAEIQRFFDEY